MSHIKNLSDDLQRLILLTKRIGFNCPTPHIADTFYTLYSLHKKRVEEISKFSNLLSMGLKATLVLENDEPFTSKERNSEDFRNLRTEAKLADISKFLMDNPTHPDEYRHLPRVINLPLKIYKANGVQENGFEFNVIKVHDNFDVSCVPDEFSDGENIDVYSLLNRVFLSDGRLYKHYRLLSWFPKYMKLYCHTMMTIMDNEGDDDEDEN